MSGQLDERLRMAAQTYRRLGRPVAEQLFLESANTISELRDDLQRAKSGLQDAEHDESVAWDRVRKVEAENAGLREELAKWERLTAGINLPEYPVSQFVPKDLERENAKLRELARHLYACLSYCDRGDEKRGCGHCPYRSVGEDCEFEMRLLELGVEVDA